MQNEDADADGDGDKGRLLRVRVCVCVCVCVHEWMNEWMQSVSGLFVDSCSCRCSFRPSWHWFRAAEVLVWW